MRNTIFIALLSIGFHNWCRAQVTQDSSEKAVSVWKITLDEYNDRVGRSNPTITGGCVTMTSATLAADMLLMALKVSSTHAIDTRKQTIDSLSAIVEKERNSLENLADVDNQLFQKFKKAYSLPYQSDLQKKYADSIRETLLIPATASPVSAAEEMSNLFDVFRAARKLVAANVLSDVDGSLLMFRACFSSVLVIAADNIQQLKGDQRLIFQARVDKVVKREREFFSTNK